MNDFEGIKRGDLIFKEFEDTFGGCGDTINLVMGVSEVYRYPEGPASRVIHVLGDSGSKSAWIVHDDSPLRVVVR